MRRPLGRLLAWAGLKRYSDTPATFTGRTLFWARVVVVALLVLVTLQAVLLIAGAMRNDHRITRNMGVAEANVLDAGPRRSTIEFVTPDRITYRPELGVLYPSELETGMRIYVEYDRTDPDLVRVQNRNAGLAVIPALSIAVVGWLIVALALAGLRLIEKAADRRTRRRLSGIRSESRSLATPST